MPAHEVDVGYMNPLDINGIKRNCLCLNVNAIWKNALLESIMK